MLIVSCGTTVSDVAAGASDCVQDVDLIYIVRKSQDVESPADTEIRKISGPDLGKL